MDRNLAIELVRVSEFAALAASKFIGRGDEKAADQAAVDAMRKCLNSLTISGKVVIGEGKEMKHLCFILVKRSDLADLELILP